MCEWLGVSKSGFYEWRSNPGSATAKRREEIKLFIKKAFGDSDGTYGYRQVHAQLRRWGIECGGELVRALMRELGLVPCQVRRRRSLTSRPPRSRSHTWSAATSRAEKPRRENGRRHHLYIHVGGWLYLATVIDCATRKIVGLGDRR